MVKIILVGLLVFAASSEHLGNSDGNKLDVNGLCLAHVAHIQRMLEHNMTHEGILSNFEDWSKDHESPMPGYHQMVIDMINASKRSGWEKEAYAQCVKTINGQES